MVALATARDVEQPASDDRGEVLRRRVLGRSCQGSSLQPGRKKRCDTRLTTPSALDPATRP